MKPLEWYDNGQFFLRRDGVATFLSRRRARFDELAGASTWPVYGKRSNGCLAVVGTCFGFASTSARFVVTAAHVLNDATEDMWVALPSARPISGDIVTTSLSDGLRSNDSLDIGVIRLAQEAKDVTDEAQFVREDQIDVEPRLEDVGIRGDNPELMYVLHGFPASKNKVVSRTRRKPPQSVSDFAFPTFPAMYEAVGVAPLTHLALKVGHNGAINGAGDEAVPPKLLGMSGGLVWRNDLSMPPSRQFRAVAVAIEFNRRFRLVLCVRLWVVFQLIRTCFPELASEIPRLTTVDEPVLFEARP